LVPAVRQVEVVRIRWADDGNGRVDLDVYNGGVDAGEAGGGDGKSAVVVVLGGVESGIQDLGDIPHEWTRKCHVDRLVGTNSDAQVGDILVDHHGQFTAVVIRDEHPVAVRIATDVRWGLGPNRVPHPEPEQTQQRDADARNGGVER